MGEDAQLDETDEGYGLSPVDVNETLIFDDDPERWICSIDGVNCLSFLIMAYLCCFRLFFCHHKDYYVQLSLKSMCSYIQERLQV